MGLKLFLVFLLTFFYCFFTPVIGKSVLNSQCSLDLNKDLPEKEPVMVKKSGSEYSLALPKLKGKKGILELEKNEELVLACTGKGNFLKKTKKDSSVSSCKNGTELALGEVDIKSVDAECEKRCTAEVKEVSGSCGKGGNYYEIGFNVQKWLPLMKICYQTADSITFYTEHTLIGSAIKGAEDEPDRPEFSDGKEYVDDLYGFNPNNQYKKTGQKKFFEKEFGSKASDYYDDSTRFLSRGHLSPDGDFLFGTWQFATYFYINAAPQWQKVNGGNWLNVEKNARTLGSQLSKDLKIITGTYDVLSLKDSNGKAHQLFLSTPHKLPVPELFFKIIYDPSTKKGISILTVNNPYMEKKDIKYICKDIGCREHHWLTASGTDTTRGFSYCCEIDDLKKTISYLPHLETRGILNGPLK